ncbi:DUF6344 domain-containing protein [Streptomyces sp. NPDC016309]|uniref:DUF6344 domain-containing protein n=1 Tax=Streptomyces sp. NPDC016309 TaxID=3364965 RepID=UPI0036F61111
MAAVKYAHTVTHFWTAFFSLLSAILTALGVKRTPKAAVPVYAAADRATATTTITAAGAASGERTTAGTGAGTATPAAAVPAPRHFAPAWAPGRVRSLPPTIKQRIRAEAHGTSPSVRHVPAALVPAQPALPTAVTRTDPAGVTVSGRSDRVHTHGTADPAVRVGRADLALAA